MGRNYILPIAVLLTGAVSYVVGDWVAGEQVGPAAGLAAASLGIFGSAYYMANSREGQLAGVFTQPVRGITTTQIAGPFGDRLDTRVLPF